MQAEQLKEHQWLQRLVGDWKYEHEARMGPDEPELKSTGKEVVRSLGGLWTLGEGSFEMPDGGEGGTLMTLGYDPLQRKFVGTFVGSMMTYLWIYSGALDASERVLTLDAAGPDFAGGGDLVNYKDAIEFIDDDHRTLTSSMEGKDGQWTTFMTGHYYRVK